MSPCTRRNTLAEGLRWVRRLDNCSLNLEALSLGKNKNPVDV